MTYELHGIKINCADGISQEEAAIYLNNQLQVMPHKTLLSLDLLPLNSFTACSMRFTWDVRR